VTGKDPIRRRFAVDVPVTSDRKPPSEFRIFAAGLNQSEQGPCVFDDLSAQSVMAEYVAHGKPTLIDYNHGTEFPYPDPDQAISAGEFTPAVRNGELWATDIHWTTRAAEYLANGEYRLFSPCFFMDCETLRVMRIISVALTNRPALDNIAPLVAASANTHRETTMDYEKLYTEAKARIDALETENKTLRSTSAIVVSLSAAAGMRADGSPAELPTLVQAAFSFRGEVIKLTAQENPAQALGVLAAWRDKAATADRLTAEKAALELTTLSAQLDGALDQASKDGKLPPALREMEKRAALAFGGGNPSKDGIDWLTAKFAAALPVVNVQATTQAATGAAGVVTLSAVEMEAAKRHGITAERALEAKQKMQFGGAAHRDSADA